jgi:anti-sigma B factor antagonist
MDRGKQPRAGRFQAYRERRGGCTVLYVVGEVGYDSVNALREEIDAVGDWSAGPCLVLDLSGLTFCDSSCLGMLVYTLRRVRAVGGRLALVAVPPRLDRTLHVTGLHGHFHTADTVEEAVAELRSPA